MPLRRSPGVNIGAVKKFQMLLEGHNIGLSLTVVLPGSVPRRHSLVFSPQRHLLGLSLLCRSLHSVFGIIWRNSILSVIC